MPMFIENYGGYKTRYQKTLCEEGHIIWVENFNYFNCQVSCKFIALETDYSRKHCKAIEEKAKLYRLSQLTYYINVLLNSHISMWHTNLADFPWQSFCTKATEMNNTFKMHKSYLMVPFLSRQIVKFEFIVGQA